MTLIHIGMSPMRPLTPSPANSSVLFKFRADVSAEHRATFIAELKTLRDLPCVQDRKLWVGSPSVTRPIEKSQGFQIALVSFHDGLAALEAYQASTEHERVTHTLLWPYKEDVVRFDFEVPEGEDFAKLAAMVGVDVHGHEA